MSGLRGDIRPVEPGLSRRAMMACTGAAITTAALGSVIPAAIAADGADAEIDGLAGLPLAAVHIERAVAVMATVTMGKWSVKIHSGQPDQSWSFHQESNLVQQAISRHRRLDAEKDAALAARDAIELLLENNPQYPASPQVKVGHLVCGMGTPDTAIIARSVEEVDRRSATWTSAAASLYSCPATVDNFRVAFAEKRRDLESQIRSKKRFERRAGLPEAKKAVDAAYVAEEHAAMAVMLTRPANGSEAAEKAAYMKSKDCFKVHYWDVDALFDALVSQAVQS